MCERENEEKLGERALYINILVAHYRMGSSNQHELCQGTWA